MREAQEFHVVIEQDSDGYFVATVPELAGCHTQAKSIEILMEHIREVIELCLEDQEDPSQVSRFIGVESIRV